MSDKNRVHPGTAEAPVSALLGADFSALVAVIADYDAAVAECPIDHPNIVIRTAARRGDCPRCGASTAGPCWIDVRAAGEAVRKLRKSIADGALGRQDGQLRDEPEGGSQ